MKIAKKLVIIFVSITFVTALGGMFAIYTLEQIHIPFDSEIPEDMKDISEASHLDGLAQFIRYYDEVLTQSARNYAFTQDKKWEERYRDVEPDLDEIIKEAIRLGDQNDKEFFSSVDQANLALVSMEYKSIELVNEGKADQAILILESDEYWIQKNVYEKSLRDYVSRRGTAYDETLKTSIQDLEAITANVHRLIEDREILVYVILMSGITSSIVIGLVLARSISKPIRKLDDAARKIANGDLDVQTNITQTGEIKSLGESFNKMVISLKELDEKKKEFTIMISHELKTPLVPIKGYTEMLKDPGSGGKLTNEKLEYVNEIDNNISKLEALIEDLLIFQKLDKGELDFSKEKFSVVEFVTQLLKDYSVRSEKQIQYVINPTEEITIETDKKLLRHALDHLITNAMDFVPENNGKIEVGAHQDGENVIFHVKDNGKGIPKREFENIFKKFYQVDAGDARAHDGMGTGLTICKGIIEGLGGKIWVESEEGKGSTFFFTIPKAG